LIARKKIELDASPFTTLVKQSNAPVETPIVVEQKEIEQPLQDKKKQDDSD